jgi:pyruvate dehydrogenase E2 component (dihydrolipoamide acetyltransferase)
MAEELFIPKLGQTVEEITIVSWLVEDGAKVEYGQPLLEGETDKAVFPIEANARCWVKSEERGRQLIRANAPDHPGSRYLERILQWQRLN